MSDPDALTYDDTYHDDIFHDYTYDTHDISHTHNNINTQASSSSSIIPISAYSDAIDHKNDASVSSTTFPLQPLPPHFFLEISQVEALNGIQSDTSIDNNTTITIPTSSHAISNQEQTNHILTAKSNTSKKKKFKKQRITLDSSSSTHSSTAMNFLISSPPISLPTLDLHKPYLTLPILAQGTYPYQWINQFDTTNPFHEYIHLDCNKRHPSAPISKDKEFMNQGCTCKNGYCIPNECDCSNNSSFQYNVNKTLNVTSKQKKHKTQKYIVSFFDVGMKVTN